MKQPFLDRYRTKVTVATLLAALAAVCVSGLRAQTALPLPFSTTLAGLPSGGSGVACTTTLPTAAGISVPGDGCPANQATLNAPYGTNVDSLGNVYWGDYNTYSLRVIYNGGANLAAAIQAVNPTQTIVPKVGYVYTLAGSRTAALASTQGTTGGKMYYCNGAGSGLVGLSSNGDNCPATYAYIKPRSPIIDSFGNVFFTSSSGSAPVRVLYVGGGTAVTNLIETLYPGTVPQIGFIYSIVKSSTSGYAGDGLSAVNATVQMYQERDVALDSKGNIYVSDGTTFTGTAYASNNNIRMVNGVTGIISTYAGSGGCAEPSTAGCPGTETGDGGPATSATFNTPYTIFFDQYDNLYITEYDDARLRVVYKAGTVPGLSNLTPGDVYTVAGGGATAGTVATSGSAATSLNFGLMYVGGIDSAGNLYFVDGTSKLVWEVNASTGIAYVIAGGHSTTKGVACNAGTTGPIATDSLGDGCPGPQSQITSSGKLAFDKFGSFYEVESGNNVLRKFSYDTFFPATAVGANATQWLAYLPITALTPTAENFTLDGVATTQFSDAGGATCALGTAEAVNAVCSVNVKFAPTQAGTRRGNLQIATATSTAVSYFPGGTGVAANTSVDPASTDTLGIKQTIPITAYNITNEVVTFTGVNTLSAGQLVTLSGFPTSTFFNGVTVTVSSTGLSGTQFEAPITLANVNQTTESGTGTDYGGLTPTGVAVDASGAAYIADSLGNRLVKVSAGNTTVTTLIASGLSKPAQVAVDGAGNVYVADTGNNRIAKTSATGGTVTSLGTGLSAPQGVAVDNQGDVFVADTGNNRVVELTPNGGQKAVNLTGLSSPAKLAIDANDDLFAVDSGNNRVVELPVASEQIAINLGTTTITPIAVAVDAAGDLYIADSASLSVVEFAPGSVNGNQLLTGLVTPKGVAVDSNGSLYVADSSEPGVLYANRALPTTSFPNTNLNTSNSAALNVTNTGNATLAFNGSQLTTAVGNTTVFSVTAATSNGCSLTATVASGSACGLTATFLPTAKGNFSETVSLVTNAANVATSGALLNGTGVLLVSTSTVIAITAPTTPTINYAQSVTATITITPASNAGSAPTGTVKYTVDGKLTTVTLPASGIITITINPAVGIHAISASYSGDVYYASSSSSLSFTVLKAVTATALTLTVGQQGAVPALTFAGTVTSATATGETGTVSFYAGSVLIGTATVNASGVATFTTQTTVYASYTFSACYNGDSNFAASPCAVITPQPNYTVVPGTLSVSVPQGGVATLLTNITPLYNYSGTVSATCTGLPLNSNCRFSPVTIAVGGSAGTVAQSFDTYIYTDVQSPLASLAPVRQGRGRIGETYAARMLLWPLAALALLWMRRRKQLASGMRLLSLFLLAIVCGGGLAALSGCSGTNYTGVFTTPTGASTVSVIFTDTAGLTHTVTYTITVITPYPLP